MDLLVLLDRSGSIACNSQQAVFFVADIIRYIFPPNTTLPTGGSSPHDFIAGKTGYTATKC